MKIHPEKNWRCAVPRDPSGSLESRKFEHSVTRSRDAHFQDLQFPFYTKKGKHQLGYIIFLQIVGTFTITLSSH